MEQSFEAVVRKYKKENNMTWAELGKMFGLPEERFKSYIRRKTPPLTVVLKMEKLVEANLSRYYYRPLLCLDSELECRGRISSAEYNRWFNRREDAAIDSYLGIQDFNRPKSLFLGKYYVIEDE